MSEKRKSKSGMNWKKHKTLIISLMALLATSMALGWEMKKSEVTSEKEKGQNYFSGEIDKFCVNNICVQKNGDGWMTTDGQITAPANKEMIDTYVQRFGEIGLGNVVSVNQNNFADLGIGVSQVILEVNGKKLEIGKINANYDGTYVREAEGKTISDIDMVLEKGHLSDINQWVNKTLTNLATLQTSKITVSEKEKSKEFTPKDGKWDDSTWMDKVVHLTAIEYLERFNPGTEIKTYMEIETGSQKVKLVLGKSTVDKKNTIYWATTDEKYYYSISADDYNLLTGKIN
jgi:hypothetical protein